MTSWNFQVEHVPTPIGILPLLTDEQNNLRAVDWPNEEARLHRLLRRHYGDTVRLHESANVSLAHRALEAYFAGEIAALDQLTVATGGTDFQRAVWAALRRIPAGETTSYGRLAATIGRPKAIRAVGAANGANPIAIVVPCHRVIGANAALTGFAGGLERKRWLLEHEGAANFEWRLVEQRLIA